ncbi:hypothetical protein TeGR_g10934, partial [Tetraparma gracilis]
MSPPPPSLTASIFGHTSPVPILGVSASSLAPLSSIVVSGLLPPRAPDPADKRNAGVAGRAAADSRREPQTKRARKLAEKAAL